MINPDNQDKIANAKIALANTEAGHAALMATGDKLASVRQDIKNSEPALINSIRQATAMGARGLDSNVELAFYMKQVGNTGRDVYSNLAALDRLDKAYGLGIGVEKKVSPEMYKRITSASARLGNEFTKSQNPSSEKGGADPLGIR
jgi:hypothetical protein